MICVILFQKYRGVEFSKFFSIGHIKFTAYIDAIGLKTKSNKLNFFLISKALLFTLIGSILFAAH